MKGIDPDKLVELSFKLQAEVTVLNGILISLLRTRPDQAKAIGEGLIENASTLADGTVPADPRYQRELFETATRVGHKLLQ